MRPRIAVGGFHTECTTWSPVLIEAADFRQLRGEEILAHPEFAMLPSFEAEWLPTLHCRSVPGGPVAAAAYAEFKVEFLDRLRAALPLDGLYLAMHGAAYVQGMDDAEGDFIAAARDVVGPDCPIAASYDLHGNVSQRVIDGLDIFAAYRTAPHIDVDETKSRAVRMLLDAIATGIRPIIAWAPVPVLLSGERTPTTAEPAATLYAALPHIDARPGVLDANLMIGFAWADEPRCTAAAVVTGTDRAAASAAAEAIAAAYWAARNGFGFGPHVHSLATCLDIAAASPTNPVVISDSGDNPTAGGVADRAEVLEAVLQRGMTGVLFAAIADPPAVIACYAAGEGATLDLSIGGALNPAGSPRVTLRAIVQRVVGEGPERQAVITAAGNTIVLAARRRPYYNAEDYVPLGLDPASFKVLVVKLGYLMPDLAAIANPGIMALTGGVVDAELERLPITRVPRPVYPWDRDFAFTPKARLSERAS